MVNPDKLIGRMVFRMVFYTQVPHEQDDEQDLKSRQRNCFTRLITPANSKNEVGTKNQRQLKQAVDKTKTGA